MVQKYCLAFLALSLEQEIDAIAICAAAERGFEFVVLVEVQVDHTALVLFVEGQQAPRVELARQIGLVQ